MLPLGETEHISTQNSSDMANYTTDGIISTMMNAGNDTGGPEKPYWNTAETVILPMILIVIMVVSLVGNGLVIISVVYFKDMQRKTYILIANLAIADFGVSLLCMPFSLVTVIAGDWVFGNVLCSINGFLEAIFLIASIHGLMHISIHKYFQLSKPLKRVIDKKWATVMIFATWVVAFTVAMTPVVGLTKNEYKPGTSQCGPEFPEGTTGVIHAGYSVLMGFIIPWTVLGFCYGSIFRNIRKHGQRMQRHSSMGQRRVFQQQKRITVTLFIVFIVFFICWAPFIIFNIVGFTQTFQAISIKPNVYCYWMGYLNSAINPVIYGWRNRSFKKAFNQIRRCCSPQAASETANGVVPARTHASSRRTRFLYPPITPSSPDMVPSHVRRFRFERHDSNLSTVSDSSRRTYVGNGSVRNNTESPLARVPERPPLPTDVSHNGEICTTTAHTNPTFIADDGPISNDPFDAPDDPVHKETHSLRDIDATTASASTTESNDVNHSSETAEGHVDGICPDVDEDSEEVRTNSVQVDGDPELLEVVNKDRRKSSLTAVIAKISTKINESPESDNENLID